MDLRLPIDLVEQAQSQEMRIMFHGTGAILDAFSEASLGLGSDPNSALGVHLAEFPSSAAEFAEIATSYQEGQGTVLVVLLPVRRAYTIHTYEEFFGLDEDGDPQLDKTGFSRMREDLISQGYDLLEYEDGEMGAVSVALFPHDLTVVGSLTLSQAYELSTRLEQSSDPFCLSERVSHLCDMYKQSRSNQTTPAPVQPRRPGP